MTSKEFRMIPEKRAELASLMVNDVLVEALTIIKTKGELMSVPTGLTGRDIAMILSARNTRALVYAELLEMTQPPEDEPTQRPPETFGTPHTVEDFDQQPE